MKHILLLFLLFPVLLFAQYPNTGNKARLGYQTTGDGLIWRGVAADTAIKPRTTANAYFQLDTANGVLRRYIATRGSWQTVSGGGGSGLTMPFDSIYFNPTTADPDTAELKYNADLETFIFGADGTIIEIGQKAAWYVKNQSGSTIHKGTVVRAAGTLGSSGRILIEPMEIDGTVDSKYLLGITASNISNGSDGYVIHFGKLRKFNTSAWSDGAVLYAGTGGTLTATEPTPPSLRLPIAFVVHSHATNGILAIRIQTGNELHELHDVDTTEIDNGGVIVWNAASDKWEASNGAALTTADTTSRLATKYWTNSNFFPILGGTLTGTGGAGFIGFPSQVSAPGTPASGLNVYAQGSSFNWKGTDGYERQFASTLTGGRTYTLPDISGTFALGTGTADRSARWSATNTLAAGNFTDNGTKVQALLPFQLQQWTTAGRPTGVLGYKGFNTSFGYEEFYDGSTWFPTAFWARSSSNLSWGSGSVLVGATSYGGTAPRFYVEQPNNEFIGEFRSTASVAFAPYALMKLSRTTSTVGYGGAFAFFFQNSSGTLVDYSRFGSLISDNTPGSEDGDFVIYTTENGVPTQEKVRVLSSGNVGINTASPTAKLHVNGTSLLSGNSTIQSGTLTVSSTSNFTGSTTFTGGAFIPVAGTGRYNLTQNTGEEYIYSTGAGFADYVSRGEIRMWTDINNNDGTTAREFAIYNGVSPSASPAATTPFFLVQKNGRVGINTTSSQRLLHVEGEARISDLTTDTPTRIVGADADGDLGAITISTGLTLSGGNLTVSSLPTTITSGQVVYSNGTILVGSGNHFWDNTKGFLGIKTATPLQELDVNGDIYIRDSTRLATTPAHSAIIGLLTRDANGYVGLASVGTGLSYSGGVLSATGTADGNGIYSGSGTLSQTTTRARIPDNGNLYFGQRFNSNADSAYWYIANYGDGERELAYGITDTASTGFAGATFYSDGAGEMNWKFETSGASGTTSVKAQDGTFAVVTTGGNMALNAGVANEISVTGLVKAKQEAYYEITSTSSPQTFSNDYSDNFVNQGGTQASFTFLFPASPEDGQILSITWGNAISTLTLDGNGNTIEGSAVTTAVAGTRRQFKYYASAAKWFKIY